MFDVPHIVMYLLDYLSVENHIENLEVIQKNQNRPKNVNVDFS